MNKISWNEDLLQRFIELIASHTGWQIRTQDRTSLCQKLETRIKLLKIFNPESYYQLLAADTDPSHHEWRQLALLLTTNETYLFRDRGQFSLLRNSLLPQLIDIKRKVYAENKVTPSLRIWSAGCSTGEEPYSLAILLKELIPDWKNWDLFILGTDINLEALEKARQGLYSSWSFRMVDPALQRQYFQPCKNEWKLDESIRKMVTFQYGNLVKDIYPSNVSIISNMDIIICRNVFVYFDSSSIYRVLEKFYKTLTPIGYLLTGHAELYGQDLGLFKSKVFPESVVYQRQENSLINKTALAERSPNFLAKQTLTSPVTLTPKYFSSVQTTDSSVYLPNKIASTSSSNVVVTNNKPSETILDEAKNLFLKKSYDQAIKKAEQLLVLYPRNFGAYFLIAQAYANLGNYHKARSYCQQAISVDSLSVLPYYLLAHLAEEQGDSESAKGFLKRIIYLAPGSISAYLELGSIYEKEGDVTRSLKMRTVALDLLKELPTNATVEQQGATTVAELMLEVKKLLSNHQ